ncbi:polysaccharide pyruvyl transferase family protein, partial [Clostridium paraputrificum]|uniref:polysaccharide pyruvyl transferase family protein n=1 Tax=Clostridium paraputrificum TaxID=29363 RepID=UPI00155DDB3A
MQAYALKKKISELGHNVEIVNYRNENIDKRYEKKLRAGISLKDFKYPRGSIDDSEKDYFIKCLQDFDYISVREDSLRKSVIETCKCDAVTVLDPTLLINSESYEEIESKELLFNERFIF